MDIQKSGNGFFDGDTVGIEGTVVAVLTKANGEKRTYVGKNIVTTKGNVWYAARGALAASGFTISGIKLGQSTAVAGSIADIDIVGASMASCFRNIDAGYPMLSDTDTDNTGAGSTVVCWRATWSAGITTSFYSVCECALASASVAANTIINRALFAASFDKATTDTLKVFINHTFLGV